MTPLLAQRTAQLNHQAWGRIKPMRQLTNECPEVLELSAQTDTFASVFSALASLQDPAISSREQVQQKAKEAAMLLSQINETFASLMAA